MCTPILLALTMNLRARIHNNATYVEEYNYYTFNLFNYVISRLPAMPELCHSGVLSLWSSVTLELCHSGVLSLWSCVTLEFCHSRVIQYKTERRV